MGRRIVGGLSRLLAGPMAATALAGCLLALLVVMATLQYRWLGQLSDAELTRLRTRSRAGTAQLAQDFDREITRAFLWLRLDPLIAEERDGEAFAAAYDRWQREAPYPRIVRGVFLLEASPQGPLRPLRFDPARRAFEPATLPHALEGLLSPAPVAAAEDVRARAALFDPIREDGPALVHAVPTVSPGTFGPYGMARVVVGHHLVVWLDRDYLLGELVPALAQRHLPATGDFDPRIEVVSVRDPGRPLYRSGTADERDAAAEASVSLLAVRINEANRDLFGGLEFRRSLERTRPRSGWTAAGGSLGRAGAVVAVRPEGTRFMAAPMGGQDGLWRLLLRHRGGPLEHTVAAVRRRNIVVSSAILIVLAAGVVMTVVATQRAHRLARAEREFVAGVSHELSTPLSVICVAGENLADGLVKGDEPVRRYGALVRDEGRRLRALVDQVLEFSRPLGTVARRQEVDLRGVVEGALAACRPEIVRRAFQVRTEFAAGLPPVTGDAALLQGAVQNLVANALKYSGASRELHICVQRMNGGSGEVAVAVEDRGLGIDPAELPRIFEPFYRGQEPRAKQIPGSGLGLSLVRRIVEEHGGAVVVESERGRGSRFTIRLPAAAEPVSASGAARSVAARAEGGSGGARGPSRTEWASARAIPPR
jgi:signal transduction histidine kinase